jgi:cyclic pyranopterin phosphate synthase
VKKLTHINRRGELTMVDVSKKQVSARRAVARGKVRLTPAIARAIEEQSVSKGNVLEAARLAAILGAKRTSELIPLCHPIPLSNITVRFSLSGNSLEIESEVMAEAKTGAEMEALTAVSIAALVVYDMCKGIDKGMVIGPIELIEKEGGKSGHYRKVTRARS